MKRELNLFQTTKTLKNESLEAVRSPDAWGCRQRSGVSGLPSPEDSPLPWSPVPPICGTYGPGPVRV